MTNATPLASEQITDAHRNAAADYGRMVGRLTRRDADAIRAGDWDQTNDVQFFAQLALSAPAPSCAPGELERLALEAERLAAESTSRVDAAELRGFATGLRRAAALSPQGLDAKEGGE